MSGNQDGYIEELRPAEVWAELVSNPDTALVDVRSRPEWTFVGVTDLSSIGRRMVLTEWLGYPDMGVNPGFIEEVSAKLDNDVPGNLFFICRSGSRSRDAARQFAMMSRQADKPVRCVNVIEGFEGDLDASGHRGNMNGWKRSGLPWRQS